MDELARIERQYGSVAEYNRVTEEENQRRYEKKVAESRKAKLIKDAIELLSKKGYLQKFGLDYFDNCKDCFYRSDLFHTDPEDDIGTFFYLNEDCPNNQQEKVAYERELSGLTEQLKEIRPDLTDDEAEHVLQSAQNDCDVGVCLETLIFWADKMYPKKKYSYTVEITETMRRTVDIDANLPQEALEIAEREYRNGGYIIDADHMSGVDFRLIGGDNPSEQ